MNQKINISKLIEYSQKEQYIGYLWLSDSETPKEYHNRSNVNIFLNDITDSSNPFIIEGQLYSENEKKSYSIKYVDGQHIVVKYDLSSVLDDWANLNEKDLKKFIPNRLAASKIVFLQYWKSQKDAFCEDMDVLTPAALVFVGFK